MTKSKKASLIILLIILLAGIFTAAELTYIHFKVVSSDGAYQSFCNINSKINCDAVAQSPWSTLLGIPISILGGLTYLFCAGLVLLRLSRFRERLPHAGIYLAWIALFCNLYSLYLAWVCYSEIGAWCLMCMVLYGVNVLFLVFSLVNLDRPFSDHLAALFKDGRWIFERPKRLAATMALLALLALPFAVSGWMEYQASQAALAEVMKKLKPLNHPVRLIGNVFGNPKGSIVLVEFSDYQCPFCRKMDMMLEQLVEKYDNLKVIRRDFPLDMTCNPLVRRPFHPHACEAARYANCVAKEGRYGEFHRALLENQTDIGPALFKSLVRDLGLNEAAVETCVNGPEIQDILMKDIQDGLQINLTGTPALIFGGNQLVAGSVSRMELEKLIELMSGR